MVEDRVDAYDCRGLTRLARIERLAIGGWWFEQEYLCQFKDAIDSYFRSEDIDAMADETIVPLFERMTG